MRAVRHPAMPSAPQASTAPPNWVASRHPLGWLIDRLLQVGPLRGLLFQQARRLIIRTAESRGIAWRARRQALVAEAEPLLNAVICPELEPPPYYRVRFHAYDAGNLCWEAAGEAEQATDAMALRVWPDETLSPQAAQRRLREAIFAVVAPSLEGPLQRVLDVGCSVGVGTLALRDWLDQRGDRGAVVEGLDLSAPMLAVARVRDREGRIAAWHHAAAEASGLAAGSFDLITLQFVCHELPQSATLAVLAEVGRLLRPGGTVALVDQDPQSSVIRRLPAPIATLLKSTEPYLEEYFSIDLPAALQTAGFGSVRSQPCDPRHRVVVAQRMCVSA